MERDLEIRLKLNREQAEASSEAFVAGEKKRLALLTAEHAKAAQSQASAATASQRDQADAAIAAARTSTDVARDATGRFIAGHKAVKVAALDAADAQVRGHKAAAGAGNEAAGATGRLTSQLQGVAASAVSIQTVLSVFRGIAGAAADANKEVQKQVDQLLKMKDSIREITLITGAKAGPDYREVEKFMATRVASGLSNEEARGLSLEFEGSIGAAKGRNISATEADRFKPMVARMAATAGGGPEAAATYGKLGGVLAGLGHYDKAEDLLAESMNFNKIMSLGVGDNPTLIKQAAMVGGAYVQEDGKGLIRSPRELAALTATASRINPETSAETLKSVTRVTRGFGEKWDPLLKEAGVNEHDSEVESLGKLFAKMEEAEKSGRSVDAYLGEKGVDMHGQLSLKSMYNYRGMMGDILNGNEGRMTADQAKEELDSKYATDESLKIKIEDAKLERAKLRNAETMLPGRKLDVAAERRLTERGLGSDNPSSGMEEEKLGSQATGFGLTLPEGMTKRDVGHKIRIEKEKFAMMGEKGIKMEGRPTAESTLTGAPTIAYTNWVLSGEADQAYAAAGFEVGISGKPKGKGVKGKPPAVKAPPVAEKLTGPGGAGAGAGEGGGTEGGAGSESGAGEDDSGGVKAPPMTDGLTEGGAGAGETVKTRKMTDGLTEGAATAGPVVPAGKGADNSGVESRLDRIAGILEASPCRPPAVRIGAGRRRWRALGRTSGTDRRGTIDLPDTLARHTLMDSAPMLRALARQPSALVPVVGLPKLWKLDAHAAALMLAELVNEGAVELWPHAPGGPSVILSGPTARALGLTLCSNEGRRCGAVGTKSGTRFRWVPSSQVAHERAEIAVFADVERDLKAEAFDADTVVDRKAPDPCNARHWASGKVAARPILILGLRPIWPGCLDAPGACRGCGGTIPPLACCLVCEAKGEPRGHQAPHPSRVERSPSERQGKPSGGKARRGLAGGKGPAVGRELVLPKLPRRKRKAQAS